MSRSLSTTSYAILGLLAIRPWTPYELTRQMRFSLGRFWPRAESKLYEEPKKLVEHGFAVADPEAGTRRRGTRYQITDAGRAALRTWLTSAAQPPQLESEPLLRVFLAEHGRKTDLIGSLTGIREWAKAKIIEDADIARSYLEGSGQFPQRTAQVTLVGRYLSDFTLMTWRWSVWALATVEMWPDDISAAPTDRQSLTEIVARAAVVTEP